MRPACHLRPVQQQREIKRSYSPASQRSRRLSRLALAQWFGLIGGVLLILYGVIATYQPAHFGRVYEAAYGGVFIVMAMLWGRGIDGMRPNQWDLAGMTLTLIGVGLMVYAPRELA